MSQSQSQPQPLATPIQKKRAAGAKKKLKAPVEPPISINTAHELEVKTLVSSNILGRNASIEDLIACTMLMANGPRQRSNGPRSAGGPYRKQEAAWLFYHHVEAHAQADKRAPGFLDDKHEEQGYISRCMGCPYPMWVPVGRDCGHGSNSMRTSVELPSYVRRKWLTLENLHAWKRDLPLYLSADRQRAFAQLRRRTNVRRAWVLLRRHARAVNLMAKVAFHWMEQTQMALCAPDGAGRTADAADFAAEF